MEFPMHWLIILVVILVLFGGRKIPELMRGMGEAFADSRKACTARIRRNRRPLCLRRNPHCLPKSRLKRKSRNKGG
jgi:TatA/E family protein of Tat protein translocase